jgi:protein SCO1/2
VDVWRPICNNESDPMNKAQKILNATLWSLAVLSVGTVIAGVYVVRARQQRAGDISVVQIDDSSAQTSDGALPVLFNAPAFKLLDQNGQPFTQDQLRDRPYVAAFVFTHCAGPCPMMFGKMARMQETIPDKDVRLVTFTVDPERDTPAVLKQKLTDLGADQNRWVFLTGDKQAVDAVARGMLQPKPQGDDSPLLHSENFLLFDGHGRCRGIYYSEDDDAMTKLKGDAERLAAESRAAGGAAAKADAEGASSSGGGGS